MRLIFKSQQTPKIILKNNNEKSKVCLSTRCQDMLIKDCMISKYQLNTAESSNRISVTIDVYISWD